MLDCEGIEVGEDKIDKIISILLKSESFAQFYKIDWEGRKFPVRWCLVHNLEVPARVSFDAADAQRLCILHFRQYPTKSNLINDSYLFAHEMSHIIRVHENKVWTFGCSRLYSTITPDLINTLRHILEDTAIDRRLYNKHKFNILPHYEDTVQNSRQYLEKMRRVPDGLERKSLLLWMIKEKICWNIIKESSSAWVNYEEWLKKSKYSEIVNERNEIASIIQDIEWDTLEQQQPVLKTIVDMCELNDYICTDISSIL
jgi:hypothetical protein